MRDLALARTLSAGAVVRNTGSLADISPTSRLARRPLPRRSVATARQWAVAAEPFVRCVVSDSKPEAGPIGGRRIVTSGVLYLRSLPFRIKALLR